MASKIKRLEIKIWNKMKNRKGASHVEIMISFALFLSLLAVIFLFLKPLKEPTLSNVFLDIVSESLKKDTEIALATLPFSIQVENIPECFSIDNPLDMSELRRENIFLKSNDQTLSFRVNNERLSIQYSRVSGSIYYIYFSFDETFNSEELGVGGCTQLDRSNVKFSAPRADKLISFKKLEELKTRYEDDYETLKRDWGISKGDFSITVFINDEEVLSMEKDIPEGKDIFARQLSKRVLINTGNQIEIKRARILIKVW